MKTDGALTLHAPFSLVSLVRPESSVALATGAPSSRYGGRLLRLRKKCPAEDVVRLRALDFVEDSEDFEEYDDVEEDQGWRVSTIACAGFVEAVDRRAMRACRAYALVATLTSDKAFYVVADIKGYLKFDKPGVYEIDFISNDGLRVRVGGQEVLYYDGRHPCETGGAIQVQAPEAGWYPIEMLYFQRLGTSCLLAEWTPPGGELDWIPNENTAHLP